MIEAGNPKAIAAVLEKLVVDQRLVTSLPKQERHMSWLLLI